MAWSIEFDDGIEKILKRLSSANQRRILDFLEERVASGDPRDLGQALQGKLAGLWRYRVGDYRVLARLEHDRLVVAVIDIGHRSTVYR